jgi:hypothetical protein
MIAVLSTCNEAEGGSMCTHLQGRLASGVHAHSYSQSAAGFSLTLEYPHL